MYIHGYELIWLWIHIIKDLHSHEHTWSWTHIVINVRYNVMNVNYDVYAWPLSAYMVMCEHGHALTLSLMYMVTNVIGHAYTWSCSDMVTHVHGHTLTCSRWSWMQIYINLNVCSLYMYIYRYIHSNIYISMYMSVCMNILHMYIYERTVHVQIHVNM